MKWPQPTHKVWNKDSTDKNVNNFLGVCIRSYERRRRHLKLYAKIREDLEQDLSKVYLSKWQGWLPVKWMWLLCMCFHSICMLLVICVSVCLCFMQGILNVMSRVSTEISHNFGSVGSRRFREISFVFGNFVRRIFQNLTVDSAEVFKYSRTVPLKMCIILLIFIDKIDLKCERQFNKDESSIGAV